MSSEPLAQVPNINLLIHLDLYSKAISINKSQFFGPWVSALDRFHCIMNTYIERVRAYCLICVCLALLYVGRRTHDTCTQYMYSNTIIVTVSILSTEPSDMSSMCSTTLASVWYSWLHSMIQCLTQQTRRDCLSSNLVKYLIFITTLWVHVHCTNPAESHVLQSTNVLVPHCLGGAGPDYMYTHSVYYCIHVHMIVGVYSHAMQVGMVVTVVFNTATAMCTQSEQQV